MTQNKAIFTEHQMYDMVCLKYLDLSDKTGMSTMCADNDELMDIVDGLDEKSANIFMKKVNTTARKCAPILNGIGKIDNIEDSAAMTQTVIDTIRLRLGEYIND